MSERVRRQPIREVSALAPTLVAAIAAIILLLGLVHHLGAFLGQKLYPPDPELEARRKVVSPVISRETTMWKAWVGFNASHTRVVASSAL